MLMTVELFILLLFVTWTVSDDVSAVKSSAVEIFLVREVGKCVTNTDEGYIPLELTLNSLSHSTKTHHIYSK